MRHWPLFDLTVRTPRLELRYPDDGIAAALMDLAEAGIHPPDFMPFTVPWTRFEPPVLGRQGMQHYWHTRAETSPELFALPMAVFAGDALVGLQALHAEHFTVTRWFSTGSWLGEQFQGVGIGKEMRAAILHLGFDGLGAEFAETIAFADNAASLGVTRSLGYEANGWRITDREGAPARQQAFVMTRERWQARRRDDITVEGLDDCLPLLGLGERTT